MGGALGALLADLVAIGSIAIPGIGLFAAGPMVAILAGAGAGAGAIAGGLGGALISAGFAVDEARRYEKEIKIGKAVIIVHTIPEKAEEARIALRDNDATIKAA